MTPTTSVYGATSRACRAPPSASTAGRCATSPARPSAPSRPRGYNWTGSDAEDDVYRDGLLLAAEVPGPTSTPLPPRPPRNPAARHQPAGTQFTYHVYYPFGEEATAFNQDTERMKFTGHERDLASPAGAGDDLDYMHARHYSPLTGRFLSIDAEGGNLHRPQTWNRFLYTRDNPLRLVDPDGRASVDSLSVFVVSVNVIYAGADRRISSQGDPSTSYGGWDCTKS